MKGNLNSLMDLAKVIEENENSKVDYIVPSEKMGMSKDNALYISDTGEFEITDHCHSQIASKLKIPKAYYDRMAEIPYFRAYNVNVWMENSDENRMVRTLDGKARALLSDKFKPLDNFFMMQAFMPILAEHKDLEVKSSSLTEKKMYLQIVTPKLEGEIKHGDYIQGGFTISNSEVGAGAFDIKEFMYRLLCSNGMVGTSHLRRTHVGKRIDTTNDMVLDVFKEDTIKAELDAYQLIIRDVLANALTQTAFDNQLNKLRRASGDEITKVTKTVQNVTKRLNISEMYQDSMIENIYTEGNRSRYGLANSITHLAHQIENPDEAYEFEKMGNRIIELSPKEWEVLNVA